MTSGFVRDYLRLGLAFNRIVDGFVDAYFGDPELRRESEDGPQPDPAALAQRARALIADLSSSGLTPARQHFLRAQLQALEANARKFAGAEINFIDEVEAYFQVRPELGDTDEYAAAHRELDALIPGNGPLRERFIAYREADELPPEKLEPLVLALASALRDVVRAMYPLPEAEVVDYEIVTNKPWSGFNYYLGTYRSRVAMNADLPPRKSALPVIVAHETYPGHHTEHCRKEKLLVEEEMHDEHAIFLVNTPECVIAEGLADYGLEVVIGETWGRWAAEIYHDFGVTFDGELAERVSRAARPLRRLGQDVAILLHDRGWSVDDVVDYDMRWSLAPEKRVRQSVKFVTDPLWRAYGSTYVEGHSLLTAWFAVGSDQEIRSERFRRLLDEPLTPDVLAGEVAAASIR